MTPLLQNLVEALRAELKQYGEMLALLEHQQGLVAQHDPDGVHQSIIALTAHSEAIQSARQRRQSSLAELATMRAASADAASGQMLDLLPEEYRPLVRALVQENNNLLQRVRDCALQNHKLMRHSMELMKQFILTLSPPDSSALPGGEEPTRSAEPHGPPFCAATV